MTDTARQHWFRIDTLPRDGSPVEVWLAEPVNFDLQQHTAVFAANISIIGPNFAFDMPDPIYWRPLPPAPSGTESDDPNDWLPIALVPHDDEPVLVWIPEGTGPLKLQQHVARFSAHGAIIGGAFAWDMPSPTHFRPLGERPSVRAR